MKKSQGVVETILEYLSEIPDHRRRWGNKRHELLDVLFIALCAIISGLTDLEDMVLFAEERLEWLKRYIELKNGIPSASTFERIFQALSGESLQRFYRSWAESMRSGSETEGQQVCIDGKSIRGAGAVQKVHMVSAWAHEAGLSLGQVRVDEHTNEITAIPELLELLEVRESVVSIDAMGCQREIAGTIVAKGGDYVLAVKKNQLTLAREVEECFAWTDEERPKEIQVDQWKGRYEKDHGRIERREVRVMPCPEWPGIREEWAGLATLVEYKCSREVIGEEKKQSTRYYISSRACSAEEMGRYLRNHWSIENRLHWMLDVMFGEDASTIRMHNAPENLNLLRKVALALVRNTPTPKKLSAKSKMTKAALSTAFLEKVLFGTRGQVT